MKIKIKYLERRFTYIKLYLRELREIESIFKSNFSKSELSDDEHTYDSLNEFIEINGSNYLTRRIFFKGETITDISEESGHGSYSSLELRIKKNGIVISSLNDYEIKHVRLMIEEVLFKSQNKFLSLLFGTSFNRLMVGSLTSSALILIMILLLLKLFIMLKFDSLPEVIPLYFFFIWIVLWMCLCFSFIYKNCYIHLTEKNDRQGFYKRNKDRIWVGIIVGIVVGLIMFILGMLI
jgi:hypothetical protein